jgi:hypothetical protein
MGPACHPDAAQSLTCDVLVAQNTVDATRSVLALVFKRADGGGLKMWAERRTTLFDQTARCGANAGLLIFGPGPGTQ